MSKLSSVVSLILNEDIEGVYSELNEAYENEESYIDISKCFVLLKDLRQYSSYKLSRKDFLAFFNYHSAKINFFLTSFGKRENKIFKPVLSSYEQLLTRFPEYYNTFEHKIVLNRRFKDSPNIFENMFISIYDILEKWCKSSCETICYNKKFFIKKKDLWVQDTWLNSTAEYLKSQILSQDNVEIFKNFCLDLFGTNSYIKNFESKVEEFKLWKNMSVFYENVRIVSDDYLFRFILQTALIKFKTVDKLENFKIIELPGAAIKELTNMEIMMKEGKVPRDNENEFFRHHLFTDTENFDSFEYSDSSHRDRWLLAGSRMEYVYLSKN